MVVPGAAFFVAASLALLTQQGVAQSHLGARQAALQATSDAAGSGMMQFDIPAQSLQGALDAFDARTGFSGLYGADAIANRRSVAVSGSFTAPAALRRLLEGSGLSSYFTATDAYVLEPRNDTNANAETSEAALPPAEVGAYQVLLQTGVRTAFCRNTLIAPGDYRIALSFRVTASGRVEQARLLDSTGNRARDAEILKTLRSVKFARGPANPEAPFVMLILPQALAGTTDCGVRQ